METAEFRDLQDHIMELSHTSVRDRVEELRQPRKSIPEYAYQIRKDGILTQLRRLLPSSQRRVTAIRGPTSGDISEDPQVAGKILTEYWQCTFDKKETNSELPPA